MIVVTIDTHDLSRSERFETFGPFDNADKAKQFVEQARADADGYFGEWEFYIHSLYDRNRWGAPKAYPWPADQSGDD